jgi:hypothetical protein
LRARASRGRVRFAAWTAGALSFLSPWALLGLWPKPATGDTTVGVRPDRAVARRPILVITKKIVYARSPSSSVSSRAPVHYVTAPSSPPAAVSCGTHAC